MKRFAIKGLIGGMVALVTALVVGTGGANAYPTLGVCQLDAETNMHSCSYSNPDGIKSVFISLDTPDGIVVVVNEMYDCESPVSVQWENLGPTHHYEVEACPPDPATPDPEPLPIGTLLEPPEPPTIINSLKLPSEPSRGEPAQHELLILVTPRIVR